MDLSFELGCPSAKDLRQRSDRSVSQLPMAHVGTRRKHRVEG